MNERIREFAIQVEAHYKRPHDMWQMDSESLEKFAELIIKECVSQAEKEEDRFLEMGEVDLAYAMQNYQLMIKSYFGVKE